MGNPTTNRPSLPVYTPIRSYGNLDLIAIPTGFIIVNFRTKKLTFIEDSKFANDALGYLSQ